MPLAAWLHDLDPIILRISGDFAIRWYGVAYALGFAAAWAQLAWLARRGISRVPADRVPDVMMSLILGVILGGRLGYVLVYERSLITQTSDDFPWWGVLMINKGGMAFHGALVGLLIAGWIVSRGPRTTDGTCPRAVPVLHVLDLLCFVVPAGLMLGRLANFVNGELLGRVVAPPGAPAPWWAVRYPQEIAGDHPVPYSPDQQAAVDALLDRFGRATRGAQGAKEHLLDAIHNGSGPAHDRLLAELPGLVSARHPSQIYQAIAEGPIIALFLWILWARPRQPGVVGANFLVAYGILRTIIEHFFRLPDPHLKVQRIIGLSRGQWLSIAMIVAGIIVLAVLHRRARAGRAAPSMGGWLGGGRAQQA